MQMRMVHKGFNYSQDGPGNRLVYHLRGCNMHCPWCSNPEAMDMDNAGVSDQLLSPEQILEQCRSARPIMIDGGGVTFTGGEPTLQAPVLVKTLQLLGEADIHTAIETNGTSPQLVQILPFLSLLIMDCKHYDHMRHMQITGQSNIQVIENLHIAGMSGLPAWVRTPLIHGFNDAPQDIDGFLRLYSTVNTTNIFFELLPYHEYGRDKWEKCGRPYTVRDGVVSQETISAFEQAYAAAGLQIIHT